MMLSQEQRQKLVTARQHLLRKMNEIVLSRKLIFSQFAREMQAYPPVGFPSALTLLKQHCHNETHTLLQAEHNLSSSYLG